MLNVGFVGFRGMVGSVLLQRMKAKHDFIKINPIFFSTSNVGGIAPSVGKATLNKLQDAYSVKDLLHCDVIITTQGSEYTENILPKLNSAGFSGYWLDASSCLRLKDNSVIVLDPINRNLIDKALDSGIKIYSGANCTVSLMLMALGGLFEHNLVEWVSSMTYQAVSGAGANNMRELLLQNGKMYNGVSELLKDNNSDILEIDATVNKILQGSDFPTKSFGAPLAGNLLPWIDSPLDTGQTKEEWKGTIEANKILGVGPNTIKIDGLCVRVGSMRCHSQALTVKLTDKNISVDAISKLIANHNQWVKVIDNNKADTLKYLTPVAVSGSLDIAVGRIRKLSFGDDYLTLFTVGDQLLWGAAEPIRRMLNILVDYYE